MQNQLRITAQKPGRIDTQRQIFGNIVLAIARDHRCGFGVIPEIFHCMPHKMDSGRLSARGQIVFSGSLVF